MSVTLLYQMYIFEKFTFCKMFLNMKENHHVIAFKDLLLKNVNSKLCHNKYKHYKSKIHHVICEK